MSWIFGVIGNEATNSNRYVDIHAVPGCHDVGPHHYVACGGSALTSRAGTCAEGRYLGWAVAGMALDADATHVTPRRARDWERILQNDNLLRAAVGGAYVAVRWRDDFIEAFADPLGVRTLYFIQLENGIAFSTRIDWLSRLLGGVNVDFEGLGSGRMAFSPLTTATGVDGIRRLGPNGHLRYDPQSLVLQEDAWEPSHGDEANLEEELSLLTRPTLIEKQSVSLGFSGGIDSRVLLALLSKNHTVPFSLHLFGAEDEPDVQLARKIAKATGQDCTYFSDSLPPPNECWDLLGRYVPLTNGLSAASTLLEKRHYTTLSGQGKLLLFGMFGELMRRQFFLRFLFRGAGTILSRGDPREILYHVRVSRPSLFIPEVNRHLERGALRQMEALLAAMPPVSDVGAENYLDLISLRSKLPNGLMAHQAIVDAAGGGYTPFAQQSVLNAIFSVPPASRRGSQLARKMIKERAPLLARYPLVMNDAFYPFGCPMAVARAWTRIRRSTSFHEQTIHKVLRHLSEGIQDMAHDTEVQAYAPYDHPNLLRRIEAYYTGENRYGRVVESWLTFELWRRAIMSG